MEERTIDDLHDDPINDAAEIATTAGDLPPAAEANEEEDHGTGIEQYLSRFDIQGGMIQFEDETGGALEKHWDDLNDQEQNKVLIGLAEKDRLSAEDEFGLTKEEITILNEGRNGDKSIEQVIEDRALARMEEIRTFQQASTLDYNQMDDDAIFLHDLKLANPDADVETLKSDMEIAKSLSTYDNNIVRLRTQFQAAQDQEARSAIAAQDAEVVERLNQDRRRIVSAVTPLNEVAGWTIDDNSKNEVLEQLLEVNENNDSHFVNEIFSDTEKLFKAAWLYRNAEAKMDDMAEVLKIKTNEAFLRGKNQALGRSPGQTTQQSRVTEQKVAATEKRERVVAATLDDLHKD